MWACGGNGGACFSGEAGAGAMEHDAAVVACKRLDVGGNSGIAATDVFT